VFKEDSKAWFGERGVFRELVFLPGAQGGFGGREKGREAALVLL